MQCLLAWMSKQAPWAKMAEAFSAMISCYQKLEYTINWIRLATINHVSRVSVNGSRLRQGGRQTRDVIDEDEEDNESNRELLHDSRTAIVWNRQIRLSM